MREREEPTLRESLRVIGRQCVLKPLQYVYTTGVAVLYVGARLLLCDDRDPARPIDDFMTVFEAGRPNCQDLHLLSHELK
ncbi:MAG: hypothetical protein KJ718_02745 [Nanoarchaeota archaeon]|nr:hypothetical protein [Nanoarchaeota archaeon]MBU1051448.1 hypothetical protein [Nanoarchaeota archaeon]MBU1987894.1 hypothetical protein [Nanoarchaeota archaeon]